MSLGQAFFLTRPNIPTGRTQVTDDDASSLTLQTSNRSAEANKEKLPQPQSPQLPHVRSLTSRFPSATGILRLHSPLPGYSLGRSLLFLFYFVVLLFAALYRDSVFKNPAREGALVASQLPWVYILATKNNFIGVLVGYGYERVSMMSISIRSNSLKWFVAELSAPIRGETGHSCCKRPCHRVQ